jgi:cellulose synthase/poly-beta-1,6-N-acetylglucosamine synthase-like glycosyltransferase
MQTVFLIFSAFLILGIYAGFTACFNRAWKKEKANPLVQKKGITELSVIIPFRNEAANLPQILTCICEQSGIQAHQWEVLFINDHSVDNGPQLIEQAVKEIPQLRLLNNPGKGKKEALLEGIRRAKFNSIITTDADCRFAPNWLLSIAHCFENNHPDMILAPVHMMCGQSFWQRFCEIEFLAMQVVGGGSALVGKPLLCNGANLAFRKNTEIPDLKSHYKSGEDMFLLEWMKQQKKTVRYLKSPEAIVQTPGPKTLAGFLYQRARWLSKAGGYRDKTLQTFSITVFSANLMVYVLAAHAALYPITASSWLAFFTIKTALDFWQVKLGADFFRVRVKMIDFIGMQLLYPLYMLLTSILAIVRKPQWKDKE